MTINCKGQLIDISSPKVMGILNLTPDSFYDGGKYKSEEQVLRQVERMLEHGATFVDMGAYSSRPGASKVSTGTEKSRIVPLVGLVLKQFPEALISIDTFRSEVAEACLEMGAAIVNDISAGHLDDKMLATVAKYRAPYVAMHMRGTPQNMTTLTDYDDLIIEMRQYFSEIEAKSRTLQLNDIILDPGFGFAKTIEQNFYLLNHLDLFQVHERPLLVGLSRKSMIYKTLYSSPEQALNGTTSLNTIALLKGANILRVHDVKEAMECIKLVKNLNIARA